MTLRTMLTRTVALSTALAIVACTGEDGATGPDGLDGLSSLAFTWTYAPLQLASDGYLPSTVTRDRYYSHDPGYYEFGYEAWDGSIYLGWYTIEREYGQAGEPGEPGGAFWRKGKDGAQGEHGRNFYLLIGLWSTGPTFYTEWDQWWLLRAPELATLADSASERATPFEPPPTSVEGKVAQQVLGEWRLTYRFERADKLPERFIGRSVIRAP